MSAKPLVTSGSDWPYPTWNGVAGYGPRGRRLNRERRRNQTRRVYRTDFGERIIAAAFVQGLLRAPLPSWFGRSFFP